MSEKRIRVLIADDHPVVRKGMRALFGEVDDIEVVGEAANGAEAIWQTGLSNPDIVLMDLVMPGMDGTEAIAEIISRFPHVHVLVLTSFTFEDKILAAFKAGAEGYLAKDTDATDLIKAVRVLYVGESPIHPGVARKILPELNGQRSARPDPLTAREMDVLRLMADGRVDQEISGRLGIGEVTVRTHVSRILVKLHATNRVQAVLRAIREGFVSAGSP